jgi:hypothetical protein
MTHVDTYEVRVKINGQPKMYHFKDVTKEHALKLANKKGKLLSCRKVDITSIFTSIEQLEIEQEPFEEFVADSPYNSAIDMDENIWNKRNKRRINQYKDKTDD